MDLSDCVEVETYAYTPRTNQSREFLESLLPMLEVALEYTSLKQPMSWEPKLFDNEAWRTGTRENRLRISVTANCLEKAMESIEREISRLG